MVLKLYSTTYNPENFWILSRESLILLSSGLPASGRHVFKKLLGWFWFRWSSELPLWHLAYQSWLGTGVFQPFSGSQISLIFTVNWEAFRKIKSHSPSPLQSFLWCFEAKEYLKLLWWLRIRQVWEPLWGSNPLLLLVRKLQLRKVNDIRGSIVSL